MDNGTLTDKQKFIQVVRSAIDKLEQQGVQSKNKHNETCAYRGENNTRCIIGFMIEDEETAFQWDSEQFTLQSIVRSWDFEKRTSRSETFRDDEIISKLKELSKEISVEVDSGQVLLLSFLQILHDITDCMGAFTYKTMKIRLSAKEWDLQTRISLMKRAVDLYEVSLE